MNKFKRNAAKREYGREKPAEGGITAEEDDEIDAKAKE
jgi:hypothetical protein